MKTVLVITNLLPVSTIERKKNENDIILVTEDKIRERYKDINFHYVFTLPKVNGILSRLSKKWKSYYLLQKKESFELRGRKIHPVSIIKIPQNTPIRNLLFRLSYTLDKKKLKRIIEEIKPSVIHAHSSDGQAFFAKKLSKEFNIPYLVTVRGINKNADKFIVDNLKKAQDIIAISPTHKKLAEKATGRKTHFIPHGVSENFFVPEESIRADKMLKFITVSRLIKLKNLDRVIEALARINGDFVYNIYGDGPEKNNLQKIINQHHLQDKVILKGFINNHELPKELCKYDMFIMPSSPETLGRVYFEAMACYLPVIATQNTGIDGIIENGKEGFLVNLNEDADIYNILSNIFENPEQLRQMRKQARKMAENFKWDKITEALYNLY